MRGVKMKMARALIVVVVVAALAAGAGSAWGAQRGGGATRATGGRVKVLDDFEGDVIRWEGDYTGSIVAEYATEGEKAFKVIFEKGKQYPGIGAARIDLNWEGYDTLRMDVFNPQEAPVGIEVKITDPGSGPSYDSRYNGEILILNGQNDVEIPFEKMTAGGRRLDVGRITSFLIFMSSPKANTTLYFDNVRVTAGEEPAESRGRRIETAAAGKEVEELKGKAEAARGRLEALIRFAHEKGIGTLEANIALVTAQLGLEARPVLPWYANRKTELYEYVAESCDAAAEALKETIDGKRRTSPVPPISNPSALEFEGPHLVEKEVLGRGARPPVLLFSMLYQTKGPLCEYFTPIDYFVHSHAFAGASRYDVERTPLYKAFKEYPDTHRVWNGDAGWCGHIVRDTASMGGGSEPVVVCLESPHTLEAIREYVEGQAGRWKGNDRILVNIMGGELSYICYCERTLAKFREYLALTHGTIEKLNEAWGTKYASFDDVKVMPSAAQAGENRARWYDWQSFNCRRFVEHAKWAKAVVREFAPEARVAVGAVSYSTGANLGRSGVDEEMLVREVDDVVLNEAGESTIATDLLRSFADGGKPMFDFEYHGDIAGILPHFLHGNTAMAMWWWPERPDTEFPQFNETALPFSWNIPLADVAEALKVGLDVRRLGPQIAAFAKAKAETAILYSRESMLQVEPEFAGLSDTLYTLELKNVYAAAMGLDTPVRFVSSLQVKEGRLADYKVLVAPAAKYVADDVAEAVLGFAEAGGTVVMTPESFLFDEYARPREHMKRLGIEITGRALPAMEGEAAERHAFLQEFVRKTRARELPSVRATVLEGVPSALVLECMGMRQTVKVPEGARVLAKFDDDGAPALVEIPLGKGRVWYVASTLGPASMNCVLDAALDAAGVARPVRSEVDLAFTTESPLGPTTGRRVVRSRLWRVEMRAVEAGAGMLFYIVNHSDEALTVRVELPEELAVITDLRDPWREEAVSAFEVGAGRTRIFAASREGGK